MSSGARALYEIETRNRARKAIARLPESSYARVVNAIDDLAEEPRPRGCRKLQGEEGWRIRVGDYRVIYEIDEARHVVTVLQVGHRRDIYR